MNPDTRRRLYGKIQRVIESNDAYGTVVFQDHVDRRNYTVRGMWSEPVTTLRELGGGVCLTVDDRGGTFRQRPLLQLVRIDAEGVEVARKLLGDGAEAGVPGAQVSKALHALHQGLPPDRSAAEALGGMSGQTIAARCRIVDVVSQTTAAAVAAAVKRVYTPAYAAFTRRFHALGPAQCFRLWEHATAITPDNPVAFVEASPFRAAEVALDERGAFADVDALAVGALGLDVHDPERIRRHGVEIIKRMVKRSGHTHVSTAQALNDVGRSIGAAHGSPLDRHARRLLTEAWSRGARPAHARHDRMGLGSDWPVVCVDPDAAYPEPHYLAEQALVRMFRGLVRDHPAPTFVPVHPTDGYHPLQRDAVRAALEHPVTVLTGSPGTGKTRVTVRIIRELIAADYYVVACSFTGKASQRLATVLLEDPDVTEADRKRLHMGKPCTLHRVVQMPPAAANHPVAVVVDEASMVALQAMAAVGSVCAPERWVVVGDPFQLPSIDPGRVLHDMIDSAVIPTTELTHVYRTIGSGGLICANARRVRDWIAADQGTVVDPIGPFEPRRGHALEQSAGEFAVTDRGLNITERADAAVAWYERHNNAFGRAQVLCHLKVTCAAINSAVRDAVNPPGFGTRQFSNGQGDHWRTNDRVICIRNQYSGQGGASAMVVANGEVGTIVDIRWSPDPVSAIGGESDRVVAVRFDSDDRIEIFTPSRFNRSFQHGYAITIHKAQGSEWEHIMLHLDAGPAQSLCCAHVVYTGFTRAQRSVTIEGTLDMLDVALLRTSQVIERRSDLAEHLAVALRSDE